MTVWALHPLGDKNISSAKSYGNVVYINQRYVYTDELEDDAIPQAFLNKMHAAVDKFEPEFDYLLIAGDHLQLIQLTALLIERWGWFRVLRYDREAGGYAAIDIIGEDDAADPTG